MLSRIRGRLTYANVVASMALFIALGGVSYAAVKLPKNSVGPRQIKKNAVTGSKVKNSSLTGNDVKNSSLTGNDVKDRSLTAKDFSGSVQGAEGAQGPKGEQGSKGEPGPKGEPGTPDGYTKAEADAAFFPSSRLVVGTADSASTTETTILSLGDIGLTLKTDDSSVSNAGFCISLTGAFAASGQVLGGTAPVPFGFSGTAGGGACTPPLEAAARMLDLWIWRVPGGNPFTDTTRIPAAHIECNVAAVGIPPAVMTCAATAL